jgi:hypothetical protein
MIIMAKRASSSSPLPVLQTMGMTMDWRPWPCPFAHAPITETQLDMYALMLDMYGWL